MTPQDLSRAAEIKQGLRPIRQCIKDASDATGIPVRDILGPSRMRAKAHARQLAMHMARETGASFSEIARVFKRDHTTIIHGVRAEAARRAEQ